MTETDQTKVVMMCWENSEDSLGKEPYEETDNKEEKSDEGTQKPKDEEGHGDSTLRTGNRLKSSIKEFRSGTEDDTSMLNTQETAQQELVYITNLENDLQNHGTKLNKEKGPKIKSLQ